MKATLVRLSALPRRVKQLVLIATDLLCLPGLFWAAVALRYDTLHPKLLAGMPLGIVVIAAVTICCMSVGGIYRAVVRAFDEKFLHDLMWSVGISVALLFVAATFRSLPMPRSVPLIYGFFVFLWVWASRSSIRWLVRLAVRINAPRRVAIYGAGVAGRQILAVLRATPDYFPVAFFDDAPGLASTRMQGLKVFPGRDFVKLRDALEVDEVLIALPSISRARRREIIEHLEPANVRVRTLPGLDQLVGGQASISDIREVDITDLLGRDPVPPVPHLFERDIQGKSVIVTGAGGSIGSELCRQVLAQKPRVLVLWELSEFALYSIERELRAIAGDVELVPILGTVLNQGRMASVMQEWKVDTVYHAAAYKHVPIVEMNPFEGLINNAFGTYRAARAAIETGVSTFVLVSTDKAVRPTNVMGASKRLAEMVLQAFAADPAIKTRFCMVRFGNVLGSSGSVVPLFRDQIAKGGPVTVTHPEVTRYFMTISEAAQLVIQAGAMGRGGDVFVLDMGESVKILSLATKMIRLSGMAVRGADGRGDIEIVFTGLRPGEKLYEELLIGHNVAETQHQRIMRAMERFVPLARLETYLEQLEECAQSLDTDSLKAILSKLIDGYVSEPPPPLPLEQSVAAFATRHPLALGA